VDAPLNVILPLPFSGGSKGDLSPPPQTSPKKGREKRRKKEEKKKGKEEGKRKLRNSAMITTVLEFKKNIRPNDDRLNFQAKLS